MVTNAWFRFAAAVAACAALVAVAFTGLSGVAPPAAAQSGCADYARLALQQARENEQRKCGFNGPEWSTDLKGHATWCATVGPDQWRASLQKRAQMLSTQCKR